MAEWKGPFEFVRKVDKVDYVVRIFDKERVAKVTEQINNVNLLLEDNNVDALYPEAKVQMLEALQDNDSVFNDIPGKIKDLSYHIMVDPKVKPISSLPYKIPYVLKGKVKHS